MCIPSLTDLAAQSALGDLEESGGLILLRAARPGDVLYGINDCRLLSLQHMRIVGIGRAAFDQTTVHGLTISDNKLESIDGYMWEGLTLEAPGVLLGSLNLGKNRIKDIARNAWLHLGYLGSLSLMNNPLVLYPGVFNGLHSLESLFLASCKLTYIQEGTFDGLGKVTLLDLSANQITEIRDDMWCGLLSLQQLSLSGNGIVSVDPAGFAQLITLKDLQLNRNYLSELRRDMFIGLKLVKSRLHLGQNGISHLQPDIFADMKSLEVLYLDENSLVFTQDMWWGLENLKHLSLRRNHIDVLRAGSFTGLQSLNELDLAFNELTHIDPLALAGLPQLKALQLWHNNLTNLNSNIFDPTDFPNSFGHPVNMDIELQGNPITCTESICWLRDASNSLSDIGIFCKEYGKDFAEHDYCNKL